MALKILAAGQKPVNEDCRRLAPTNTVNQMKFGLTQWVNANDSSTINPANAVTARLTVILVSSFIPHVLI